MNWNKFFTGTTDHGDEENDDETETEEEEEGTDSNGTVSTDKRSHFLGLSLHKLPHNRLSLRCIKSAFLAVNAVTFVSEVEHPECIVAIVTSAWTLTDDRIMSRLIGQRFLLTTLLLVGLVASLASFLGIVALVRKRRNFLNIYVLCYVLFLCVMFVSAILSFWIFDYITQTVQDDMMKAIESYVSSTSSRDAWDNTHIYLKCCGIKSAKDWANYQISIPKSCCAKSIEQCIQLTEALSFKSGCLKSAVLLLKSHVQAISVSALMVFLIVLLSFLLALCILGRTRVCHDDG